MTVPVSTPRLPGAEHARRLKAVNTARASVCLEGFVLDADTEAIYARYVQGELELPDVWRLVHRHAGLPGDW